MSRICSCVFDFNLILFWATVQLFEVIETDKTLYLIMEYASGGGCIGRYMHAIMTQKGELQLMSFTQHLDISW